MKVVKTPDDGCFWCQNPFFTGDFEQSLPGSNDREALRIPQGVLNQGRNIYPGGTICPLAGVQLMQVANRQIITGNENVWSGRLDRFGKGL